MNTLKYWRFPFYVMPNFSIGNQPLAPQNLEESQDRILYLQRMVKYLDDMAVSLYKKRHDRTSHISLEELIQVRNSIPYHHLTEFYNSDHGLRVRETSEARSELSFNKDFLKLIFVDGRFRGKKMSSLNINQETQTITKLISFLYKGISKIELDAYAEKVGIDLKPLLNTFIKNNLVEEVSLQTIKNSIPPQFNTNHGDSLTWLGHAGVIFQSEQGHRVCVDPFLKHRIDWIPSDYSNIFSDTYADSQLFINYGPTTDQLSPGQLPDLDAVLITHQDIDHFNLETLMAIPKKTPIIVPCHVENAGWSVDLKSVIKNILGSDRNVIELEHGKKLKFGNITVLAIPFKGEMPASFQHRWNSYVIQTPKSAVICASDSAITKNEVDILIAALHSHKGPVVLCARSPHNREPILGYREATGSVFSSSRLWPMYIPIHELFTPTPPAGIKWEDLKRLAKHVSLKYFFPYAVGSTPWFRFSEPNMRMSSSSLSSMSLKKWNEIASELHFMNTGTSIFPGKFSHPVNLLS